MNKLVISFYLRRSR